MPGSGARVEFYRAGKRRVRAGLPRFWRTLRAAVEAALFKHNALGNAKGVAYSALLAFFPLLATATTLLVRAGAQFIADPIYRFLSEALPPGTQKLVYNYFTVRGSRPVLVPVTAMLISLWAGSGAMISLMQGFHAAYRVPSGRSFLRERVIAVLLVIWAAVPVLLASSLIIFGGRVEGWIGGRLGLVPQGAELRGWVSVLGGITRYFVAVGSIVLGAGILYHVGPNRRQRWSRVWPGAMVATALWLAATSIFAWYVRHLGHYNVMYGSIAAVVLLLIWMYLLAVIAYVGCEFNAALEEHAASEHTN